MTNSARIVKRIQSGCRLVYGNTPHIFGCYRLINPETGVMEGVDDNVVWDLIHWQAALKPSRHSTNTFLGTFCIKEEYVLRGTA